MTVSRFNLRAYVKKYNKIYRVVSFFDNEYFHLEDYKSKFIIKNDNKEHLDPYSFSINEIELMQSTGLVDKNGKEIFEGDFLKVEDKIYCVYNYQSEFCFKSKNEPSKSISQFSSDYDDTALFGYFTIVEVIGNKFKNPELLEEFIRK